MLLSDSDFMGSSAVMALGGSSAIFHCPALRQAVLTKYVSKIGNKSVYLYPNMRQYWSFYDQLNFFDLRRDPQPSRCSIAEGIPYSKSDDKSTTNLTYLSALF